MYFLNHLEEAGLLDQSFNPYKGKDDITRGGIKVHVVDNPGFAPIYTAGDKKYTFDKVNFYADITGLFGQYYSDYGRFHEGVDFAGKEGTPVHSLIHAKVVECGWTDQLYGKAILFTKENDKGMYLIAHLNEDDVPGIEPGVSVLPGQTVAYVGGSAYSGGKTTNYYKTHLHVSYYDVQYNKNDDEDKKYINRHNDSNLLFFPFKSLIGYNRESEKNPFWHNSGNCSSGNATNV
jgi:murein DD-endopeptidase MepM/ murein hydrolase activator NlpD